MPEYAAELLLSLLRQIRTNLAAGCCHYNKRGWLLITEADIICCLRDEGKITIIKESP